MKYGHVDEGEKRDNESSSDGRANMGAGRWVRENMCVRGWDGCAESGSTDGRMDTLRELGALRWWYNE